MQRTGGIFHDRFIVDYISGAVVRAAKKQGRNAPTHEMMVKLVHAMENRKC